MITHDQRRFGVLLIDDHGLFRESLSRLLQTESDFHIVGTCASATEALALPHLAEIDIVLLDYDLGHEQGTFCSWTGSRSAGFPGHILMVTAGMSDGVMFRALENGASGIFLKHSPPTTWSRRSARYRPERSGSIPGWRVPLSRQPRAAAKPPRTRGLSEREQAVLKGVFEGLTNKEIGTRLAYPRAR